MSSQLQMRLSDRCLKQERKVMCVKVYYKFMILFSTLKKNTVTKSWSFGAVKEIFTYSFWNQLAIYFENIQQSWCTNHKISVWQNLLYTALQVDNKTHTVCLVIFFPLKFKFLLSSFVPCVIFKIFSISSAIY